MTTFSLWEPPWPFTEGRTKEPFGTCELVQAVNPALAFHRSCLSQLLRRQHHLAGILAFPGQAMSLQIQSGVSQNAAAIGVPR